MLARKVDHALRTSYMCFFHVYTDIDMYIYMYVHRGVHINTNLVGFLFVVIIKQCVCCNILHHSKYSNIFKKESNACNSSFQANW